MFQAALMAKLFMSMHGPTTIVPQPLPTDMPEPVPFRLQTERSHSSIDDNMQAAGRSANFKYWAGGAASLFGITAYSTYRYVSLHKDSHEIEGTGIPGSSCFDTLAHRYDQVIGAEETWMGFGLIRGWYLSQHVKGDVLEISAGTGRNLPHYPFSSITSLTLTDVSRPMLTEAEDKYFDKMRLGYRYPDTLVSFKVSDAHCMVAADKQPQPTQPETPNKPGGIWGYLTGRGSSAVQQPVEPQPEQESVPGAGDPQPPRRRSPPSSGGSLLNIFRVLIPSSRPKPGEVKPLPQAYLDAHDFEDAAHQGCCAARHTLQGDTLTEFPAASFDTVVDTFGLCSHANPVQVLRQAARVCRPDGKIVLLEHGRGKYEWINNKLDDGAPKHKQSWGCWWNRDILGIVREAGLRIESVSRWHFGTTYVIIARPV